MNAKLYTTHDVDDDVPFWDNDDKNKQKFTWDCGDDDSFRVENQWFFNRLELILF